MSTKVLEKLNKIENEFFDLKKEVYKTLPDKFVFYDDPSEIKKIIQAVRQTRKRIWKEKYRSKFFLR